MLARAWQTQVLSHEGWKPAETSEINDVFQGVLIPESVERVRIEFKPFSHYTWMHMLSALCYSPFYFVESGNEEGDVYWSNL